MARRARGERLLARGRGRGERVDRHAREGPVSVPRFFCDGASLAAGETAFLAREEWRHVRARRLADGDAVVLLGGSGLEAEAVLTAGGTAARVGLVRDGAAEPRLHVTVLLA